MEKIFNLKQLSRVADMSESEYIHLVRLINYDMKGTLDKKQAKKMIKAIESESQKLTDRLRKLSA